jgi:rhodanese-related sulfurtransferase
MNEEQPIELISMDDLKTKDHVIVDVRTDGEIEIDPIAGAMHIELSTLPARFDELPENILLAFVCAGNVRSAQAAEFIRTIGRDLNNYPGRDQVCILDKFSF